MKRKKQRSWKRQKGWFQKDSTSEFISLARKLVKECSLGKYEIILLK